MKKWKYSSFVFIGDLSLAVSFINYEHQEWDVLSLKEENKIIPFDGDSIKNIAVTKVTIVYREELVSAEYDVHINRKCVNCRKDIDCGDQYAVEGTKASIKPVCGDCLCEVIRRSN